MADLEINKLRHDLNDLRHDLNDLRHEFHLFKSQLNPPDVSQRETSSLVL